MRCLSPCQRRFACRTRATVLAIVVSVFGAVPAAATSLRARINEFYEGPFHAPPQGLLLGELVATTVLPPASAPGFGAVDEDSVGPLVTERAATLGARRLVVSARYDDIAWAPEDERDSLGNRIGPFVRLNTEGRLGVENGYMRFEPTSGKLGSLPIPQSTLDEAVKRLLASPENRDKLHVPPDVRDIRIQNGELIVTYR